MNFSSKAIPFAVLCCGLAHCTSHAQSSPAGQPGTAVSVPSASNTDQAEKLAAQLPVARLSRLAGSAIVQAEDGTSAPVDAALNMPLPAGERLSTGDNGEAEVEFADGSVMRLTPRSEAGIERMDPESHAASLQAGNGLFYLELRSSDRSSYTVNAAELQITPEQNASFRLHVQDGQVEAAVLAGSISVTRPNAYTVVLQAGESLRTDPKNGRRYLLMDTVPLETWDSWNERLAQAAKDEEAARTPVRDSYSSDQAYGWADLDANGTWYSVPGEGEVWQPTLADISFDPYGSGAWVYGPGGYAWASGYGWGWLPYRCGAWSFYQGFGWGWSPASGCLSFGFGGGYGGDGGYRIHYPRSGWHPPQRPVSGGDMQNREHRHPTIPVVGNPTQVGGVVIGNHGRTGEPVRVAGVLATPVKRIGPLHTPEAERGTAKAGSAVGSSLLRDFPVRTGTHEPVLGMRFEGTGTAPGQLVGGPRAAEGVLRHDVGAPAAGRVPLSTDPPFGATGAPPLGAAGSPPLGATGAPPTGITGAPPFGETGRLPVGLSADPRVHSHLPPTQPRVLLAPQPARASTPAAIHVAPAAPMPRMAAPPPPPPPAPRPASAPSAPATPSARPR